MAVEWQADVPAELADIIAAFKETFVAASAATAKAAADVLATDAAELGEAHSNKTLATE